MAISEHVVIKTTRDAYNALPDVAKKRIEKFRTDLKEDPRHREIYICKASGYLEGMRDAGIINDYGMKCLRCYLTV